MNINFLSENKWHSLRLLWLGCLWLGVMSGPCLRAVADVSYPMPYTFTTLIQEAHPANAGNTNETTLFGRARGLVVDKAGNIYAADTRNHTICRLTPTGKVTVLAGRPGSRGSIDGMGDAARFYFPQGLAIDSADNIYVADSGNNTIRCVTPAGKVTTLAGSSSQSGAVDGSCGQARFNYPSSVAVDDTGNIFVADLYNTTIRKITPAGKVTTLAGKAGSDGSADGKGSTARFICPVSLAVGNAGDIYVVDMFNGIRKVTPTGVVTTLTGNRPYEVGHADGTGRSAQFNHPYGVVVDGAENIYVTDSANHTIRRIMPDGKVMTLAGRPEQKGNADGTGAAARFDHPGGIALDHAGNLYVSDWGNGTIRKGFPANQMTAAILPKPDLLLANP